jgi:hypothetical protein
LKLDVNRSIPAGANDLGQSLGVILIILVDLHLERGARMPRIEANHFEAEIAQLCTIHGVMAPASIPIRALSPAYRRKAALICSGTEGH